MDATESTPKKSVTKPDSQSVPEVPVHPPTKNAPAPEYAVDIKTKRLKKRFFILIAIIIPVLYLGYRIGIGYYYSPEVAYKRDAKKIDEKRPQALAEAKQKIEKIDAELMRIAPTISADMTLKNSTISLSQQDTKGELSRIDPPMIYEACVADTVYKGGGKFDPTPPKKIGNYAYCFTRYAQYYVWTGSKERLASLVARVNDNLGLELNLNDIANSYIPARCLNYRKIEINNCLEVKYEPKNDYNYQIKNLDENVSLDWSKVFTKQNPTLISPLPDKQNDTRYVLHFSSLNVYHIMYSQTY